MSHELGQQTLQDALARARGALVDARNALVDALEPDVADQFRARAALGFADEDAADRLLDELSKKPGPRSDERDVVELQVLLQIATIDYLSAKYALARESKGKP